MKSGKSEIIIVLDRSGSMDSIRLDMQGALQSFLDEQRKLPGECLVSLYQFDNQFDPVFEATSLQQVQPIVLLPRGGTALHDAICTAIDKVGARLSSTPESERPESVIFVIITDGEENASREFHAPDVKVRIDLQQTAYNWRFVFFGANQDAVQTAAAFGIGAGTVLTYAATAAGVQNSGSSLHAYTSSVRSCAAAPASFTEADRKAAVAN